MGAPKGLAARTTVEPLLPDFRPLRSRVLAAGTAARTLPKLLDLPPCFSLRVGAMRAGGAPESGTLAFGIWYVEVHVHVL